MALCFGNQMVGGHWSFNGVPIIAPAAEPGSLALVFSALIGMLGFSRRADRTSARYE